MRLLSRLTSPHSPLDPASRHYELALMRGIEASQDWGVTAAADAHTRPAVKNGWRPGGPAGLWVINSTGVIRHSGQRLLVGNIDIVVHADIHGAAVVNQQAARQLRHGAAILNVSSSEEITPVVAEQLRARDITVEGIASRLEPPGGHHDLADVVGLLDRWRRRRGE